RMETPALPSRRSANDAALGFATTTLARFAHLALALHRRLLVVTPPLDLLQDPFLRHLLFEDLQRLVDGIPDFNFQRSAEQCLQASLLCSCAKRRIRHPGPASVKARSFGSDAPPLCRARRPR